MTKIKRISDKAILASLALSLVTTIAFSADLEAVEESAPIAQPLKSVLAAL